MDLLSSIKSSLFDKRFLSMESARKKQLELKEQLLNIRMDLIDQEENEELLSREQNIVKKLDLIKGFLGNFR